MTTPDEIDGLRTEMARLREELAALRTEVHATESNEPDTSTHDRTVASQWRGDRREALKRAGAVAASAAVGGAALAVTEASPAVAANGDVMHVGAVNFATTTTEIGLGTGGLLNPGHPGFVVSDGTTTTSSYTAAIAGIAETAATPAFGVGVYGRGALGVLGAAAGAGSVGLTAEPTNGAAGLWINDNQAAPPTRTTMTYYRGAVTTDINGDLWACVIAGAPGTWRKLAGPASAGTLHVLATPIRVYDSRPPFPPATGPKTPLVGGTARTIDLTANSSGVPVGASAALVSLVATGTSAAGFMAIYRDGIAWPGTSNVNFGASQSVGVTTLTALSTTARCAVYANVATDVVLDVLGYYQ